MVLRYFSVPLSRTGRDNRWWETLLHTYRERRVLTRLLRNSGSDIAIVGVPWQLQAPAPERVLAEEEPATA